MKNHFLSPHKRMREKPNIFENVSTESPTIFIAASVLLGPCLQKHKIRIAQFQEGKKKK